LRALECRAWSDSSALPLYSYRMQTTLYTPSKNFLAAFAFLLLCAGSISGFLSGCNGVANPKEAVLVQPPFSLSIVPGRSGDIAMAKKNPNEFYVVLTNISGLPQSVWESWNSWGYQAISFELTTTDGKKFVVSKKQQEFTMNYPSKFLVQPGEHQVYAIGLDELWETNPTLPKSDEMPITLKAIYKVTQTPEAIQYKVWTGRVESHSYNLSLRQW
jgi:hypothetical protein